MCIWCFLFTLILWISIPLNFLVQNSEFSFGIALSLAITAIYPIIFTLSSVTMIREDLEGIGDDLEQSEYFDYYLQQPKIFRRKKQQW